MLSTCPASPGGRSPETGPGLLTDPGDGASAHPQPTAPGDGQTGHSWYPQRGMEEAVGNGDPYGMGTSVCVALTAPTTTRSQGPSGVGSAGQVA